MTRFTCKIAKLLNSFVTQMSCSKSYFLEDVNCHQFHVFDINWRL